jgi:hypothetical protein
MRRAFKSAWRCAGVLAVTGQVRVCALLEDQTRFALYRRRCLAFPLTLRTALVPLQQLQPHILQRIHGMHAERFLQHLSGPP